MRTVGRRRQRWQVATGLAAVYVAAFLLGRYAAGWPWDWALIDAAFWTAAFAAVHAHLRRRQASQ
jgi:hypothetical protein